MRADPGKRTRRVGGFGRAHAVPPHAHHLRPGVARNRILLLLAVIGPGIITSNVDNDPGGITTYSLAGSHYGYGLLWMMIPILIALVVIQEMCVRMAIVTGKGLADLIRENFGIKMTFYILVALLVTNMFNTMSEFAGVAAGAELLGISRYIVVPMGAVAIAILILRGNYRFVERVFLVAVPLLHHLRRLRFPCQAGLGRDRQGHGGATHPVHSGLHAAGHRSSSAPPSLPGCSSTSRPPRWRNR